MNRGRERLGAWRLPRVDILSDGMAEKSRRETRSLRYIFEEMGMLFLTDPSLSFPRIFRRYTGACACTRIYAQRIYHDSRAYNVATRRARDEGSKIGRRLRRSRSQEGLREELFRHEGRKEEGKRETSRLREMIFAGRRKKKDSRKLGEPHGPCECQQTFALRYMCASARRLRPASVRGMRSGTTRWKTTYAEYGMGRDTRRCRTGRFFSAVTRERADKFSQRNAGTPTIISGS